MNTIKLFNLQFFENLVVMVHKHLTNVKIDIYSKYGSNYRDAAFNCFACILHYRS